MGKTAQIQLRVTNEEKAAIRRAAKANHADVSAYILSRVLPQERRAFARLIKQLDAFEGRKAEKKTVWAALADLLWECQAEALEAMIADELSLPGSPYEQNYLAAMVEVACVAKGVSVPGWLQSIPPLEAPVFGSDLPGLRLHLLTASPPAFRRRNIFIDSTLGDRV